ncbi:MAG TPA: hypothetical protein VKQ32_06880 [Polyangia bacterium]|nr:hypothetical protein [Polyangia bacterium]
MKMVFAGTAFRRSAAGLSALAAIALAGAGCTNNHLLGAVDGDGGPPGSNDGAVRADDGPPPTQPNDAGSDAREIGVLGPSTSWTGYVENYQFPSGSDVVKIAFASDDAGQVVGTVILGNGTPPPPATDPNVGYPPGYGAPQQPVIVGPPAGYIAEGYAYSMRNGTLVGSRLRFGVSLTDLWQGWCALQTPVAGSSSCLPNWGGMSSPSGCALLNPATNQYVPVDCGKFDLCFLGMICRCDASGCQVQDYGISDMFDVSINNDRADGSMDTHNVHFTKDP